MKEEYGRVMRHASQPEQLPAAMPAAACMSSTRIRLVKMDTDSSDNVMRDHSQLRRWLQRLVRQEKGAALTALISVFRRFHIDLLPRFGFSAPSWL